MWGYILAGSGGGGRRGGGAVAAPDPHSGLGFPLPYPGTHWEPCYGTAKRQELQLQGRLEAPKVSEEAFLATCPQSYTVMLAEPLSSLTLAG